ncbi:MAG: polysulfide reductase NrfD [Anaerolineaceae bacterium]|nr:MAG: polysulfide reductase NrfD [Anaerolineaceae bacterium]
MAINVKIKSIKLLQGLPRFAYLLAVLTALGMSASLYRLYAGLGDTTNMSTVFPWGLWISFDLTTVAFAGAAFTLAALVYIFHMHDLHAAVRPTVLFGLLGYGSVLVILFFDLGRWDRFWHFLVYPNLSSALFEVSWCIAIYTTILIYEFSPVLLEKTKYKKLLGFIEKITIPMVIAGITFSSMHQSSLGSLFVIMEPRLHPLWYSIIQPEFFLLSSLAAGISTIIIGSFVSIKLFGKTLEQKMIEKLGRLMPWILGLYLVIKVGELAFAGELDLLFTSGMLSVLFLAEMILGVIIPAVLFSIRKIRTSRVASLVAALFVAAGILLNRFDATWFAIKKLNGESYFPSWIEIALLVGVASGVLLVYTLAAHFFPVFSETLNARSLSEANAGASQPAHTPAGD